MHLVGIGADDGDPRARLGEPSRRVRRLPEHGRADDQQRVERRKRLAQARPVGGEKAGEQRMILREAGPRAERLLEDRHDEALRQLDERRPGLRVVGAGSDHERRRLEDGQELGERVDCGRIDGGRTQHATRGCVFRASSSAGASQSSIGTITSAGPRRGRSGVVRALDRAGHLLRADGLLDGDRVLAGEPVEPAGEERLEDEVPPILLPDEDDERRLVHARRRQRPDRVAETRRRVHDRQRRLAAADRKPGRHRDDRPLVQREHERQVVRQARQKRNLGRARVREERRQPAPTEDVERGIANGRGSAPDFLRDFDDQAQLRPLLLLAEHVAFDRRGEAALRREAELLERRVLRGLLDAPLERRPSTRARRAWSSPDRARRACRPSARSGAARNRRSARRPTP